MAKSTMVKSVVSYNERLALIQTPEDVNQQIKLAAADAKALYAQSSEPNLSFYERLQLKRQYVVARDVAERLQLNCFDIEDALKSGGASKKNAPRSRVDGNSGQSNSVPAH